MEDKKSKIEDIQRRLYDQNENIAERHKEGVLHHISRTSSSDWKDDYTKEELENMKKQNKELKPKSSSFFKKFFIASIIFFFIAVGFAVYKFYSGDTSVTNDKIEILVLGNAFAKGGESLPLQIEVTNKNNAKLEFANLLVEYPKGASDESTDVVRLPRDTIGTILPGESIIKNIDVVLFGEENSVRNIKISLEYHPEGSNAIFTKEIIHEVNISSAPMSLDIEAPDNITKDQSFTIKINTILNTVLPEGNNILQIYYPNNFIFESSNISPSIGNSVWNLSSLSLDKPFALEIKGRVNGNEGEEESFRVYAGGAGRGNPGVVETVYNSVLHKVSITKPFLETRILVNGEDLSQFSVHSGGNVNVSIAWANNLPTRITDAEIVATLSGNVLDKGNVNPYSGFFDSQNGKIIWSKNTTPNLASIEPGETGTVEFNVKPSSIMIGNTSVRDPQINIEVSIRGKQPTTGTSFDEVNNFVKRTISIISDFQIATSAKYLSGAFPPKAESETRYLVTWTLSNTANTISGARARASIPVYVKFVGISSGSNDSVSFNDSTREVIWDIGTVKPNTGFGVSKEISFIIALNPSVSQVGSIPQLMKELYLSGVDSFTKTELSSEKQAITTLLRNDPNFQYGYERVVK